MTTLLLMRHGEAAMPDGVDDFDRALTDNGKRDAQRVGHYLAKRGLVPEFVVASPARRAADSAEKCIKAAGATDERITLEPRIYEASLDTLRDVVADYRGRAECIMLVGHNPGFERLLHDLVVDARGERMGTATLAVIDLEFRRLDTLVRPDELPRGFEVDTVVRDRPAYYYTQSGVLPFRISKGQVEILLVSKRGKNRWGIPKGIVEPGMTATDSAAKECEEEAGALGSIDTSKLGEYRVDKWGGTCTVAVYPLEVTELKDEWDERFKRERRWFHAEDAQQVLKVPELAPMIDGLMARYMKVLE